ncbi:MAG: hypothetical protein CYG59_13575 [Chloroflexi bacterium]|nr:MAG: hypothetical protein CYG59_13575 [Chloroflexota bacterium]
MPKGRLALSRVRIRVPSSTSHTVLLAGRQRCVLVRTGYCRPQIVGIILNMSDAIILFSHGSVLCGAGQNLTELAARMQARGDAAMVEVGYLNYSEPRFGETVRSCVARGATEIIVVPYFLVAGKFVKEDLPQCIANAERAYPNVKMRVAEAVRFHPALADALLACAERAQAPAAWRDTKAQAAAFCRASKRCPLYGSNDCPATRASEMVV